MNGYLSSLTFTKVKRYRDIFRGTLTSSKCKIMDLLVFKGIVYKKKKGNSVTIYSPSCCSNLILFSSVENKRSFEECTRGCQAPKITKMTAV